ncbi:MAG: hypothetical protein ACD_46C00525G0002 [uncultured bacterium]|nr:MAG: hypothetical protein ACD_46C00525G0002 [uncultured bacterium]
MKKYLCIVMSLLLSISCLNAYAYSSGVTLMSSKTEMSPGLQGGFIEKPTSISYAKNQMTGNAHAYAKGRSSFGHMKENIKIEGEHGYIIENRSGQPQYYEIEKRLVLQDGRFIRKQDTIRIENNAVDKGNSVSFTNQYFDTPGGYHFNVETIIRGEYNDYARDTGYITVNA